MPRSDSMRYSLSANPGGSATSVLTGYALRLLFVDQPERLLEAAAHAVERLGEQCHFVLAGFGELRGVERPDADLVSRRRHGAHRAHDEEREHRVQDDEHRHK